MSAAEALKAARAAGVHVDLDDNKLKLKADAKPPAVVIEFLRLHKAGVMALLREEGGGRENEKSAPAHSTAPGLTLNYCACGEVGIFGVGWSFREPEGARGYCAACVPPRGRA